MRRRTTRLIACALLLAFASHAEAYLSCDAMHVGVMQSDLVVAGTLDEPQVVQDGRRMHGRGDLVIEHVVFGDSAVGDTLTLVWEFTTPPHLQGDTWGSIKSPADPDYSEYSGHPAIWLLGSPEGGEVSTEWLHCSVWEFGGGTGRLWSSLDRPLIRLKNMDCDVERDWWKVEAVIKYLESLYSESRVEEKPQRSN
jgi:hypothetical protein